MVHDWPLDIQDVIDDAREELTKEIDNAQYDLYEKVDGITITARWRNNG